jgi:mRNA-degrading endonuclease toxin of MazEF toxin-antitoxin module
MTYQQGELIFLNFPFDDAAVSKPRPCIIVGDARSKFGAYIVAKITSNPKNDGHSFWLDNSKLSYPSPRPSQVRINDLHTISGTLILHKFSRLDKTELIKLCDKIKTNFDVV